MLVHFELPAGDTARAVEFWSGLFGWEFGDPMEAQYWMTRTGESQGGAIFTPQDGSRGLLAYFDTDDIDATLDKVRSSGGTADEKQPIPNVGWFAHCTDTEGNRFGLFESDESVTVEG
jgi:predicted enzyme related to lactoylglutathione lyase